MLTRGAVAAVVVLAAGSLTACGGDDDAAGSADSTDAADSASSDNQDIIDQAREDAASLEGSEALEAIQVKAEEYGYENCMMSPAGVDDPTTIRLSCVETSLPQLSIFDRADRESGSEIVEQELDGIMEASGEIDNPVSREEMGSNYRALDGDDVVGSCQDFADECDAAAEVLGLDASMPEGALTTDELDKKRAEDRERESREYEEQQKKEEAERQKELQTYSGWADLDEAKEQLEAWDISCYEPAASDGDLAWCDFRSALVTFGMSADDLDKQDVFKEVGRDEMRAVSDGDWEVMCAPGSEDTCDLIADKTGKSVKNGV